MIHRLVTKKVERRFAPPTERAPNEAAPRPAPSPPPPPPPQEAIALASNLLTVLFQNVGGSLTVRLWDGSVLRVGKARTFAPESRFTLVFHHPGVVASLVLGRDPLRLVEAYFRGEIDVEGDFFAALGLKDHLRAIGLPVSERLGAVLSALRLRAWGKRWSGSQARPHRRDGHAVKSHSKEENREAIEFHYNVSNEFYALWLDTAMVYSCAYFERPDDDLDSAQLAKLDHICRKLLLQPGERLLDIGCGWGALVVYAAKHYGVQAHGITLSIPQLELARSRIAQAGLPGRVTVELRDYRDLAGEAVYDKVSSVGMFEHVGLKNLPVYFSTVNRVLKPGGLFLNHGITTDEEGWHETHLTELIHRYVFPDGQLDTVSNIQRGMEHAKFEILDVEALRPHYALTLRRWVGRLEQNHEPALRYVNEGTYRVWRLYMAACALQFEAGWLGIYQVLASKRAAEPALTPLTRKHLYRGKALLV